MTRRAWWIFSAVLVTALVAIVVGVIGATSRSHSAAWHRGYNLTVQQDLSNQTVTDSLRQGQVSADALCSSDEALAVQSGEIQSGDHDYKHGCLAALHDHGYH
jgi:cell division protein YceG involved in septum cleavage